MTRIKSTYLALIAVLLLPVAANAMPIAITGACPEVPTSTCFIGADGLDVGGVLYNVRFVEGAYSDVFAANPGVALFDGNQALAAAVAQTLTDAFRLVGFLPTQDAGGPNGGWAGADIAFAGGNGSYLVWTSIDFAPSLLARGNARSNWMVFTPSAVPEPGTLALFGIGLFGLGLARRRKTA